MFMGLTTLIIIDYESFQKTNKSYGCQFLTLVKNLEYLFYKYNSRLFLKH